MHSSPFATIEPLESRIAPAALIYTVTNTSDTGSGSLRDAISQANAHPGTDFIRFAPAIHGTISLFSEIPVTDSLVINGGGKVILNGGGNNRIFNIDNGLSTFSSVRLQNLTLVQGNTPGDGGAIRSTENLTLIHSQITGSRATLSGGGLYESGGNLALVNSRISGNIAQQRGGGVYVESGPGKTLTVANTRFVSNHASGNGGGLVAEVQTQKITGSLFVGNSSATRDGGGAYLDNNFGADGHLLISQSTFTGNTAQNNGGGVYIDTFFDSVTVSGSHFDGNSAENEGGGLSFLRRHARRAANPRDLHRLHL